MCRAITLKGIYVKLYILSLAINLVLIAVLSQDTAYSGINYILVPAFILTLFGFIYQYTKKNIFGYIAISGFFIFIPIGILGILSIKNEIDQQAKLKFIRKLQND